MKWQTSAYLMALSIFSLSEFDNFYKLSPQLIGWLFEFRDWCQKPITILHDFATSGHSHKNSYHYFGMALDIAIGSPRLSVIDQWILVERFCAFNGVGMYPDTNFIHIDTRAWSGNGRWIRDRFGNYLALNAKNIEIHCL